MIAMPHHAKDCKRLLKKSKREEYGKLIPICLRHFTGRYVMKKALFLCSLIMICVSLISCAGDSNDDLDDMDGPDSSVRGDVTDIFVYSREHMLITEESSIKGLWVRGERIYYYFTTRIDGLPSLVVASVLQDGTDKQYIEIPMTEGYGQIFGVHFAAQDNIGVLISESGEFIYTVYDSNGVVSPRQNFGNLSASGDDLLHAEHVNFTENGKIIFSAGTSLGSTIYILDIDNGSNEKIHFSDRTADISLLKDGSTVAVFNSDSGTIFRVIDGKPEPEQRVYNSSISVVSKIISVGPDSPFDLLLSDSMRLFGYCLETEEQTVVLNWVETGFSNIHNTFIDMLPDGRFVILTESRNNNGNWEADLYILTPAPREETPGKITITLGGVFIYGDIVQTVIDFNAENQTHQIVLHDYMNDAVDWETALLRLRTELITGRGPDILINPDRAWSDNGFLVDLYPFIDADAELNRTDFFPNILKVLEGPNGTLTRVTNEFQINTMIGMADDVRHITSWTPQYLLSMMDDISHMHTPFGSWLDREDFIRSMILYSGDDFVDWSSRRAYLDSEAFKSILEIARYLPDRNDVSDINDDLDDYTKMRRKEQLLTLNVIGSPASFQTRTVELGETITLGFPTSEGGTHFIVTSNDSLGINVSSGNIEEAWLFLRQYLLPPEEEPTEISVGYEGAFPVRIDAYDKLIEAYMTPIMVEGNEIPRFDMSTGGNTIHIFAMTQAEADKLRLIIESAKPTGRYIRDELWGHLRDDVNVFFNGGRTAEDTARIMQNRVQIYLDEQT